ncbi:glutamate receptor ionotropic, kainate glr-3-like [Macrobrachium rosenbergii]|uniref:glutamate receptor ionotropic, kainate glr-3-like n=1 Tax=Macrobrachium rosenbergii TaxID=79674 RepID=UPI0034D3E8DD
MTEKRLHPGYTFVMPEDKGAGVKLPNGSWTGVMRLLIEKEISFTALGIGINPDRIQAIDFSEYLYVDEWTAAFRRPKLESDVLGYVKPFTPWEKSTDLSPYESNGETNQPLKSKDSAMDNAGMWTLAILLSQRKSCGVMYTSTIITLLSQHKSWDANVRFYDYYTSVPAVSHGAQMYAWVITTLLSQASIQTPSGGSLRVLSTVWLMMSFILVTVYRSNLKAMLILPKVVLPFDNLEQLTETGLRVWTPAGSILHSAVEVGQIFLPPHKFKCFECLHSMLCCARIVRLRESGILDYIYKKGVHNATECLKPVSSLGTPNLRPMDLGDFYGVFMVYAGGEDNEFSF